MNQYSGFTGIGSAVRLAVSPRRREEGTRRVDQRVPGVHRILGRVAAVGETSGDAGSGAGHGRRGVGRSGQRCGMCSPRLTSRAGVPVVSEYWPTAPTRIRPLGKSCGAGVSATPFRSAAISRHSEKRRGHAVAGQSEPPAGHHRPAACGQEVQHGERGWQRYHVRGVGGLRLDHEVVQFLHPRFRHVGDQVAQHLMNRDAVNPRCDAVPGHAEQMGQPPPVAFHAGRGVDQSSVQVEQDRVDGSLRHVAHPRTPNRSGAGAELVRRWTTARRRALAGARPSNWPAPPGTAIRRRPCTRPR